MTVFWDAPFSTCWRLRSGEADVKNDGHFPERPPPPLEPFAVITAQDVPDLDVRFVFVSLKKQTKKNRFSQEDVQSGINNNCVSRLKFGVGAEDASPCSSSWLPQLKMQKAGRPYHSQPIPVMTAAARASVCHCTRVSHWHLYLPEIWKNKKTKRITVSRYYCKMPIRSSAAAEIKAITRSCWNTVTLIFNRMCFIASYLQSDLSDPTNHKLPYQRRISGPIGVVKKDRFIEYLYLNIFLK